MKREKRTEEEKQKLLEAFKESGQAAQKWCKETGIPTTTLSNWLKREKKQKAVEFVEVTTKPVSKEIREESVKTETNIMIHYRNVRIGVTENFHEETLRQVLQVVKTADV